MNVIRLTKKSVVILLLMILLSQVTYPLGNALFLEAQEINGELRQDNQTEVGSLAQQGEEVEEIKITKHQSMTLSEAKTLYDKLNSTDNYTEVIVDFFGVEAISTTGNVLENFDYNNITVSNKFRADGLCALTFCGITKNKEQIQLPYGGFYSINFSYSNINDFSYIYVGNKPLKLPGIINNNMESQIGLYSGNKNYVGEDYTTFSQNNMDGNSYQKDGAYSITLDENEVKTPLDLAGADVPQYIPWWPYGDNTQGSYTMYETCKGVGACTNLGLPNVGYNSANEGELCPYIKAPHNIGELLPTGEGCDYVLPFLSDNSKVKVKLSFVGVAYVNGDGLLNTDFTFLKQGDFLDKAGEYRFYFLPYLQFNSGYEISIPTSLNLGHGDYVDDTNYLTVKVNDSNKQFFALDDAQIKQSDAPQNEEQLINLFNPKVMEVQDFKGEIDASNIGEIYTTGIEVVDFGGYDIQNPKIGQYELSLKSTSPYTGNEVQKTVNLTVVENDTPTTNGDLFLTTPIAMTNSFQKEDVLIKANPIMAIYKDKQFLEAISSSEFEVVVQNMSVEQNNRIFLLLDASYNNFNYENILEIQITNDATPLTDEISISVISPITVATDENFDPINTTNAHAYDFDNEEIPVQVAYVNENISVPTQTDKPYQIILSANNDFASAYEVVDVYSKKVPEDQKPLVAGADRVTSEKYIPSNKDELLDFMDIQVIDSNGEDITNLVEVFSVEESVNQITASNTLYDITFGVTSPTTGLTTTLTRDYTLVDDETYFPNIAITGNDPVFVKKGDGTDETGITSLINPQILLYINFELQGVVNGNIKLIQNNGYSNDRSGTYYFVYEGQYSDPTNNIDPLIVSNIFEVNVEDKNIQTYIPIEIIADENVKIVKGSYFDPIVTPNVKAISVIDGNITDQVSVVVNDVDTSTPGQYPVSYYVKDSTGNDATKNIVVNVYDTYEELQEDELNNQGGNYIVGSGSTNKSILNNTDVSGKKYEEELSATAKTSYVDLVIVSLIYLSVIAFNKK